MIKNDFRLEYDVYFKLSTWIHQCTEKIDKRIDIQMNDRIDKPKNKIDRI